MGRFFYVVSAILVESARAQCAANQYVTSGACAACPNNLARTDLSADSTTNEAVTACDICAVGHYDNDADADNCVAFPPNAVRKSTAPAVVPGANESDPLVVFECPAGTFNTDGTSATGCDGSCTGNRSTDGTLNAINQNTVENTACTQCAANHYDDNADTAACVAFPPNAVRKSTAPAVALGANESDPLVVFECPAGTFNTDGTSATGCDGSCTGNRSTDGTLNAINQNTVENTACTQCAANHYDDNADTAACVAFPLNSVRKSTAPAVALGANENDPLAVFECPAMYINTDSTTPGCDYACTGNSLAPSATEINSGSAQSVCVCPENFHVLIGDTTTCVACTGGATRAAGAPLGSASECDPAAASTTAEAAAVEATTSDPSMEATTSPVATNSMAEATATTAPSGTAPSGNSTMSDSSDSAGDAVPTTYTVGATVTIGAMNITSDCDQSAAALGGIFSGACLAIMRNLPQAVPVCDSTQSNKPCLKEGPNNEITTTLPDFGGKSFGTDAAFAGCTGKCTLGVVSRRGRALTAMEIGAQTSHEIHAPEDVSDQLTTLSTDSAFETALATAISDVHDALSGGNADLSILASLTDGTTNMGSATSILSHSTSNVITTTADYSAVNPTLAAPTVASLGLSDGSNGGGAATAGSVATGVVGALSALVLGLMLC